MNLWYNSIHRKSWFFRLNIFKLFVNSFLRRANFIWRICCHLDSLIPIYNFCLVIFCNFSLAMKFSIIPSSIYLCTITQNKCSLSLFFIIYIKSLENLSIWPFKLPVSMHHILFPFTKIISVILVSKFTFSLQFILIKLSFIWCSIRPLKFTKFFATFIKNSFKICSIVPELFSLSMLHIPNPLTYIFYSLIILVFTIAMGHTAMPLSPIVIQILMNKKSFSFE